MAYRWYGGKVVYALQHGTPVEDWIPANSQVTSRTRRLHQTVSAVACLAMCVLQAVVVWGIEKGLAQKGE